MTTDDLRWLYKTIKRASSHCNVYIIPRYIYIYIYVYTYIYIYIRIYIYISTHIHTHVCIYVYICICIYVYVYMYLYLYLYMYMYTYICTCICIYLYLYDVSIYFTNSGVRSQHRDPCPFQGSRPCPLARARRGTGWLVVLTILKNISQWKNIYG